MKKLLTPFIAGGISVVIDSLLRISEIHPVYKFKHIRHNRVRLSSVLQRCAYH